MHGKYDDIIKTEAHDGNSIHW